MFNDQTLTVLSPDPLTSNPLAPEEPPSARLRDGVPAGENLTDQTPRLWPFNTAAVDPSSVDHILIVRSCEADAKIGANDDTSIALISFSWATRVNVAFATATGSEKALSTSMSDRFHFLMVLSSDPVIKNGGS